MNDFYVITPTNGDIQHHGILGQKWGRRNGPPYPLDGSDHSAVLPYNHINCYFCTVHTNIGQR